MSIIDGLSENKSQIKLISFLKSKVGFVFFFFIIVALGLMVDVASAGLQAGMSLEKGRSALLHLVQWLVDPSGACRVQVDHGVALGRRLELVLGNVPEGVEFARLDSQLGELTAARWCSP